MNHPMKDSIIKKAKDLIDKFDGINEIKCNNIYKAFINNNY